MSYLRASVWVDGAESRTVGDVRQFIDFCNHIGLSNEARVEDELMVDLKVKDVEIHPDRPNTLVISFQP